MANFTIPFLQEQLTKICGKYTTQAAALHVMNDLRKTLSPESFDQRHARRREYLYSLTGRANMDASVAISRVLDVLEAEEQVESVPPTEVQQARDEYFHDLLEIATQLAVAEMTMPPGLVSPNVSDDYGKAFVNRAKSIIKAAVHATTEEFPE